MKVTKDILGSLTSDTGVVSKEAITALGVERPLRKGWRKRILGGEVCEIWYNDYLERINKPERKFEDLETLCEYGERTRNGA
jgi:hypothetical protein